MKTRTLPLFIVACCTLPLLAADWPQWRGPDRTTVSKEKGLMKAWPKSGPSLLWTYSDAGIGYSGPAIVGNRLYSIGADHQNELRFGLRPANGGKHVATLDC